MGYWYQDSVQSGFSHTASYGYDGVNRLNAACTLSGTQCATSGSNVYSLAFAYDQFGNMWCTGAVGGGSAIGYCPAWSYNSGTNQLSSSTGCTYDAAGDLTKDCSTSSNHTYQWDAEGRVASVDNGSTWSFTYNALGQRVQWGYSGGTNEQLFDPSGTWLGQVGGYDLVPRGAGYLVLYFGSETDFNHINNLSSTTVRTNHAGTAVEDMLFYPWGQVWRSWGSGGYNFAQLPYYDTTTNTSITQFRLQSPGLGRWLSPDPAPPDITNPQSLNRYPYVLNNPTTLTDRLGLWPTGSQPICEASPVRPHGVHAMYSGGSGCFVGGWGEGGMLGDQPTMGEPGLPDMGFDMYGNDIFDALSGEPGTYLYFGTNGSLGFGFSIPLWQETENYIDATMQANPGLAELVPPSGYVVVEQQLGADVVATGLIPDIEALAQEQLQLADMMDAGAYYLNRLTKLGFGPENPIGENFAFWQTMLNIENSWQGLGYSQDPTLQYGAYLNAYSTQYQNFLVYQANFLNFMPKGW